MIHIKNLYSSFKIKKYITSGGRNCRFQVHPPTQILQTHVKLFHVWVCINMKKGCWTGWLLIPLNAKVSQRYKYHGGVCLCDIYLIANINNTHSALMKAASLKRRSGERKAEQMYGNPRCKVCICFKVWEKCSNLAGASSDALDWLLVVQIVSGESQRKKNAC